MNSNNQAFESKYQALPNSELRIVYKRLLKRQKLLSKIPMWILVPATVVYVISGWFAAMVSETALGGIAGFLDFVFFFAAGLLMTDKNPTAVKIIPVGFVFAEVLKTFIAAKLSSVSVIMAVYLAAACFILSGDIKLLNFLRSLPDFPFEAKQQETAFNGMSRKQVQGYAEQEMAGRVQATNYEDIFTADNPEEIANPKRDTSEDLQQHKVNFRCGNYYKNTSGFGKYDWRN